MNALKTYQSKLEAQIQSIIDDLTTVHTWDDFARRFLLGTGKSPRTIETYLEGCRQFYDFHGGAHPVETATPEHIEQFYDSLISKGSSLATASLRISALKFMYARLADRLPYFDNPFNLMDEGLKAKLSRSEKDESEKGALTASEYRAVLAMLKQDTTLLGRQNYAYVRFLVVSGLRAAEAVGLTWRALDLVDGVYRLTVRGKGGKVATIAIEDQEAVRALRRAFRLQFGRYPKADDHVLNGTTAAGMTKSALWYRTKRIIETAKAEGIIRQNLTFSTHCWRHTCASLLVAAGVDLYTVQRHMRHSNLNTTETYLHHEQDKGETWARIHGEAAA